MSNITADSNIDRNLAPIASLQAATELKRTRNDAASEREYLRIMRKVEHEFDGSLGRGGVLRRGLAKIKTNSLTVPAERKRQLILSTSGRSFHGKGAIYSKKLATTGDKKRRRAASSGAAYYRYIDSADQCEPFADGLQISESHVSYIDGCRVETTDAGDRLSSTNIEGNFVDRMRFFDLTEGFERNSHGDKITFDPNRPSAEIAAATADPACDPALRATVANYLLPHQGKPIKIQLKGTNKDLRRHLEMHGMDLSKAKLNEDRLAKDGIAFHTGRSGRTHFRWVFELPVEFTSQQREMVLVDLCAYMDREKCMYAAVIHAPDPANDERNYHLHLIFYDRPCRRLKGTEADLQNVAKNLKSVILEDIEAKKIKEGEWDFTVERHYLCNRTWKTHYPFRAEKSREITKGKDWQARFRRNYADIVNEVSAKTGGGTAVYDPRSYNDRNVDISPSKHLGQLHASEVAGIPTLIGLSNESNQANDERRAVFVRYEAEKARLDSLEAKIAQYRPGDNVNPVASNWAANPLRNISDAQHAAKASLAMDLWLLETARERSRATLVRDRQKRASQKGPAHERQQREQLASAAEAHLANLDRQDASMKFVIRNVEYQIESAPVVKTKAIELNAYNCAALSRGYVSPKIAKKQDQRIAIASSMAMQPVDLRIGHKPAAPEKLTVVEPKRAAVDAFAMNSDGASASHATPANPLKQRAGNESVPMSLGVPPPKDIVQHGVKLPAYDAATLRPRLPNPSVNKDTKLKEWPALVIPPLPKLPIGQKHTAIHSASVYLDNDSATTAQKLERTEQPASTTVAASLGSVIDVVAQPPTISEEANSKEQTKQPQKAAPALTKTERHIDSLKDATSVNVLVEKLGHKTEGSSSADAEPTSSVSSTELEAAIQRSEFEKKIILHVVRTERIRLQKVDGKLVLPQHKLIPADWHRQVPFLQIELASDQRLIEKELKSFVCHIGANSYEADAAPTIFFNKVFKGQPEIVEALAERQRKAAQLLVQQHALAAHRGFGFS